MNPSKEKLIMESLARHNNNRAAVEAETGCSKSTIIKWCKRHGIPIVKQRPVWAKAQIRWNLESIEKLRDTVMRNPRPTLAEIAAEMGVSEKSAQTAMSRHGLNRIAKETTSHKNRKFATIRSSNSHQKIRPCLRCDRPFFSEGFHNRQCPSCFEATSEMAA